MQDYSKDSSFDFRGVDGQERNAGYAEERRAEAAERSKFGPLHNLRGLGVPPCSCYCGTGAGVAVSGLGASGALGAVNPGMFGFCVTVPLAASTSEMP